MILKNCIRTLGPVLPRSLCGRITMRATCELLPAEIQVFNDAFRALSRGLLDDPSAPITMPVTLIFTDSDSISLTMKDHQSFGIHFCIAFYPLHLWRAHNLSYLVMLIAALEELCHHFWSIEDEIIVKEKVTSLVQILYPQLSKDDLYKPDWSPDALS